MSRPRVGLGPRRDVRVLERGPEGATAAVRTLPRPSLLVCVLPLAAVLVTLAGLAATPGPIREPSLEQWCRSSPAEVCQVLSLRLPVGGALAHLRLAGSDLPGNPVLLHAMARDEMRTALRVEERLERYGRVRASILPGVAVAMLIGLVVLLAQLAWIRLGPVDAMRLRVGSRGVELESLVVPPGELQGWTIEGSALVFHTLEELVSTGPIADPEGLLEAVLPELERLRAAQREPGPPVPAPMRALVEAAG